MESYTKLRIIGAGSFGTVWLTRSKEKYKNYVLKEIPLSVVEERERSFVLNEVKVLSKLRHMNIIRYKEAFLSNGFLCISMEYAHEGDLSERIRKQGANMLLKEQVIDWFIQLCLALKYIHGMNILHRDIKCQNIFISKDNVIKLGDFGIACVLQSTLDHAQTVIGTPYYLSPEICQRQPYNHKSDIWALGCVLYEMTTLRHPFESSDFPQLVLKILHGDFTPIPDKRGTLLQDLVSILLRVDPSERPSAKQILHIPAMQPYVNKVLTRGKKQRSESVSSGAEGQSTRKGNVWRRPDVICEDLSVNRSESDVLEHLEEKPETLSVDVSRANEDAHDVLGTSKAGRKRISSEVFAAQDEQRLFHETATKKMNVSQRKDDFDVLKCDKENLSKYNRAQGPPTTKPRSYSTSIVRESSERVPLAPLTERQMRLRETFDVIPEQQRVFQDTYTKGSSCRAYIDGEINGDEGETSNSPTCKKWFSAKEASGGVKPGNAASPKTQKTTDFLKVVLGGRPTLFKSISPESSLKDYVQAMKSTLEESLGFEMFNALRKYLGFEAEKELNSGEDVCETLFEALGEEGIVFVPLMLQFIQCEKHLSAK